MSPVMGIIVHGLPHLRLAYGIEDAFVASTNLPLNQAKAIEVLHELSKRRR